MLAFHHCFRREQSMCEAAPSCVPLERLARGISRRATIPSATSSSSSSSSRLSPLTQHLHSKTRFYLSSPSRAFQPHRFVAFALLASPYIYKIAVENVEDAFSYLNVRSVWRIRLLEIESSSDRVIDLYLKFRSPLLPAAVTSFSAEARLKLIGAPVTKSSTTHSFDGITLGGQFLVDESFSVLIGNS